MANAKIILDKRRSNSSNTFPLVIQLAHKGKTRVLSLKLMLSESQWLGNKDGSGSIQNHINSKRETNRVLKKLADVKYYLTNNDTLIERLDINTLKAKIEKELFGKGEVENGVAEEKMATNSEYLSVWGRVLIEKLKATNDPSDIGNANWYQDGINSIISFNGSKDIKMINISSEFLEDYKTFWMKKISKQEAKINTLSARLRAISAIMNKARKAKPPVLDPRHTPFEDVQIPSQEASKRALNIDAINKLRELQLEVGSEEWKQRNYFLFMFNNQGMNFVDISYLKVHQVSGGRLRYTRSKTKRSKNPKVFNIKQTDEALKILSYYLSGKKSDDYIFPILSKELENDAVQLVKVRKQALKDHNTMMKELSQKCGIEENVTSYVTRHSWANIAKQSGASTEKIKDALGQSNVIITETYLESFEDGVLDELNEAVTSRSSANKSTQGSDPLSVIERILNDKADSPEKRELREKIFKIFLKGLSN